ncbi:hypothetical protein [Hansschlegelia zhihuaiae]|uniref:Uncharacterized protein n=1 Tax=Hansschlegelia zhihuaiae TaxID=405005 RepID=A0A4Q0M367_9HYPH|nr:hypothetical protein [Hansschlegelia zhihuaiae]RXF67109.1 hypothetical protein EK403_21680 [Hansschlegelia zhihuaiae]
MTEAHGPGEQRGAPAVRWAAGAAVAAGLACAVAAAVTLWASEGARVFADAALAAVIACF